MNFPVKPPARWANLRKAAFIAAAVLIGTVFLSGVCIFAYQMLNAA
ncbi:MAG: hypothetical protein JWQ88_3460 [Rhodoferax sp.]|nr:hypothetical protein [Rhodoferax sp.]